MTYVLSARPPTPSKRSIHPPPPKPYAGWVRLRVIRRVLWFQMPKWSRRYVYIAAPGRFVSSEQTLFDAILLTSVVDVFVKENVVELVLVDDARCNFRVHTYDVALEWKAALLSWRAYAIEMESLLTRSHVLPAPEALAGELCMLTRRAVLRRWTSLYFRVNNNSGFLEWFARNDANRDVCLGSVSLLSAARIEARAQTTTTLIIDEHTLRASSIAMRDHWVRELNYWQEYVRQRVKDEDEDEDEHDTT